MTPSSSAEIAGRLHIILLVSDGEIREARITSNRPVYLSRLYVDKPIAEVPRLMGLLYSVCATAQQVAAVEACEKAFGFDQNQDLMRLRRVLYTVESLKEHTLQVLLHWPRLLAVDTVPLGGVRVLGWLKRAWQALSDPSVLIPGGVDVQIDKTTLERLCDEITADLECWVFGIEVGQWRGIENIWDFETWMTDAKTLAAACLQRLYDIGCAELGRSDSILLPELNPHDLEAALALPDFAVRPEWHGEPRETTPFARQHQQSLIRGLSTLHGNGLLSRMTARLSEIAGLVTQLREWVIELPERIPANQCQTRLVGSGVAQVEAARGRLIHGVEQRDGRIRDYRIVAPTEWNFHPHGVLARSLRGLRGSRELSLRQQTDWLVHAIDPCVDYDVEIRSRV